MSYILFFFYNIYIFKIMVEQKEAFKVPTIKLNNGVEFPVCGLGTFTLKD